jgi:type II secretory pathway pseudopilin PulG
MRKNFKLNRFTLGFSLVEMAIVLIILSFVLGAILMPVQVQRQQLTQSQTENTLEIARKALIGFVQQNGRLPCPATATSNTDAGSYGQENPSGGTRYMASPAPPAAPNTCAMQSGYLPAATLGLQPVDQYGFALDAWNNRIRYAVANDDSSTLAAPYDDPSTPAVVDLIRTVNGSHPACGGDAAPDFTTSNNISAVGIACLVPNLSVFCGSVTTTACVAGTALVSNAVAVIFSTGENGNLPDSELGESLGIDEISNKTATTTFYSRTPTVKLPTTPNSSSEKFDDLVTWISPYILYNAMIEVGQLH